MGMNVISAKDHGESFLTLESGRAVAFMMDDALLAGEVAKARNAGDWVITGTPQSREAYGCMLRKDDPQFKKVVDAAIAQAMTSGEAEQLYKKWFLSPIPPKGLNLNLPAQRRHEAALQEPERQGAPVDERRREGDRPAGAPRRSGSRHVPMSYHWRWEVFLDPVPSGGGTYLGWMIAGLEMTVAVSLTAWFIALVVGSLHGRAADGPEPAPVRDRRPSTWRSSGTSRCSSSSSSGTSSSPSSSPGRSATRSSSSNPLVQQFLASMLCLGLFTGARVCEQVRSGIDSLSRGQKSAGARARAHPAPDVPVRAPAPWRSASSSRRSPRRCSTSSRTPPSPPPSACSSWRRMGRQLVDYTAQPYESFIAVTLAVRRHQRRR